MSTCPSCGENMEKGYVIGSGGAIFWSEKPRKWTTFGFERLVVASPVISQVIVEGYRCSKCKIILFGYEKEEKDQRRE